MYNWYVMLKELNMITEDSDFLFKMRYPGQQNLWVVSIHFSWSVGNILKGLIHWASKGCKVIIYRFLCPPGNLRKPGKARKQCKEIVWQVLCRKKTNKKSISAIQHFYEVLSTQTKTFWLVSKTFLQFYF